MEWEKMVDADWWYVRYSFFIAKEKDGHYEIGHWTLGRLPEQYPTLEAAKLAAEILFG